MRSQPPATKADAAANSGSNGTEGRVIPYIEILCVMSFPLAVAMASVAALTSRQDLARRLAAVAGGLGAKGLVFLAVLQFGGP
jgi:hypothetical protein